MKNSISLRSILFSLGILLTIPLVLADSENDSNAIDTGTNTGASGTVISSPSFSPTAGTYSSTQSITMTAEGATAICYTSNGTDPVCDTSTTCSTGTVYSGAVNASSGTTSFRARSCYPGDGGNIAFSSISTANYTISSGGSGGGGGGGGGGGSSSSLPYTLPLTPSTTNLSLSDRAVRYSTSNGNTTRDLTMIQDRTGVEVHIPLNTRLVTAAGTLFTGTLYSPVRVLESGLPPTLPLGHTLVFATNIRPDEHVQFYNCVSGTTENSICPPNEETETAEITITIPIPAEYEGAPEDLIVMYYDEENKEYVLIDTFSIVGDDVVIRVNHLTIFTLTVFDEAVAAEGELSSETGVDGGNTGTAVTGAAEWVQECVVKLREKGILDSSKSNFEGSRNINRAEVAKMLVFAAGHETDSQSVSSFPDIAPNAWFVNVVEKAKELGWVTGYTDGEFKAGNAITRAEALKMTLLAAEQELISGSVSFRDVLSGEWFYPYISAAYTIGIVNGYQDGTFRPNDPITRNEFAKIVCESFGM